MPTNIDKLKGLFIDCVQKGKLADSEEDYRFPAHEINGKWMLLDRDKYSQLLDSLQSFGRQHHYQADEVRELVEIAVNSLLKKDAISTAVDFTVSATSAQETFDRILEFLTARRDVLIPIVGLELQEKFISLDNCELYRVDPNSGPLYEWLSREPSEPTRKIFEESFTSAGVYAKLINLGGDQSSVIEQAMNQLDYVLHVIRFYLLSSRISRDPAYMQIGVAGAVSDTQWQTILVRRTTIEERILPGKSSGYRLIKHVISTDLINKWNKSGFFRILECFQSSNDFDKRIERSVRWYSIGQNANTETEAFVSLAIALEGLLVGNEARDISSNWGSITQKLAERVAFLLGNSIETRKMREKQAKHLYGVRSGIVHEGEDVSFDDLHKLDCLVKRTIITLIQHEFGKWEDFLSWITDQKYELIKKDDH